MRIFLFLFPDGALGGGDGVVWGSAAETFGLGRADRPIMWCCTTFMASGFLLAELHSVSELLTFVASHGVWNKDVDVVPNVSSE